jgi:maltose O-acetyltransferase
MLMRRRGTRAATSRAASLERLSASLRRLGSITWCDIRWGTYHVVVNSLGGSVLVPRAARGLLYSALGMPNGQAVLPGCTIVGSVRNLRLGPGVYVNQQCFIEAVAPVTLGAHTALGMGVQVITSHHAIGDTGWRKEAVGRPVTIGDRVWVGGRAVICPGAVIEDDVVIAAGAVVAGRLESGGMYAGVPARRIRDYLHTSGGTP